MLDSVRNDTWDTVFQIWLGTEMMIIGIKRGTFSMI